MSTIWRILSRRGFVVAQPRKRPQSSLRRFEALQPNERVGRHHSLAPANSRKVDILNNLDDHSRLVVAAYARRTTTAADVVATFRDAPATINRRSAAVSGAFAFREMRDPQAPSPGALGYAGPPHEPW